MVTLGKGPSVILWCVLFFLRRVLFAAASLLLIDHSTFQIAAFCFASLAVVLALGWIEPLGSAFENRLELANNFGALVMTYSLLSFTDFAPDASARYLMGYFLILLTAGQVLLNLYFIVRDTLTKLKRTAKKKWAARQARLRAEALAALRAHAGLTPRRPAAVIRQAG